MIESALSLVLHYWPSILLAFIGGYAISNRFNRGLNKYPGPLLASFTDLWRFFDVYQRRPEVTHQKLHAKHGDIVRLGPNTLSFADPKALKTIYGLNKGFTKVHSPPSEPKNQSDHITVRVLPCSAISRQWPRPPLSILNH